MRQNRARVTGAYLIGQRVDQLSHQAASQDSESAVVNGQKRGRWRV
jgi:hypothetical protein